MFFSYLLVEITKQVWESIAHTFLGSILKSALLLGLLELSADRHRGKRAISLDFRFGLNDIATTDAIAGDSAMPTALKSAVKGDGFRLFEQRGKCSLLRW